MADDTLNAKIGKIIGDPVDRDLLRKIIRDFELRISSLEREMNRKDAEIEEIQTRLQDL